MTSEVPSSDELLAPILRSLADGAEHPLSETFASVASAVGLDEHALALQTASGQSVFKGRAGWARWDLRQAGLVDITRRGFTKITDRGGEALANRPDGLDQSYLRQFPEFLEYVKRPRREGELAEKVPIDEAGEPLDDPATNRNVWIEKTIVQGRPDRITGDYSLGKALWSPIRDKAGKDIYHFMRDVRPGDIILHLTDNRGFTGFSIASDSAIETDGVEGTDWEGPAYLVRLEHFTVLDPTLPRETFFSEPFRTQLVALLKAGLKNAFYNEAPSLNQGAYLTPAPYEMVATLNDAYKSISGKVLLDFTAMPKMPAISQLAKPGMTFDDLVRATLWTKAELDEIITSLSGEDSRRQIVLAGPPGTGKTYVARQIIRYLTGDDISRYRIIQFHQSYTYEQFIEGLRPVLKGSAIEFAPVPGVVLEIADQARKSPFPHYLIIDEMNRANMQRVFGELMFLFEYRDEKISLPYSQDFSLPDNLYFVGTMNTADRSIRNIDLALRRRFEVFECHPSARILRAFYETHENDVPDLVAGFERLNTLLSKKLDEYHTIGHSFFMADHFTHETLRNAWKRRLKPLIAELFFDEPDKLEGMTLEELWPSTTTH